MGCNGSGARYQHHVAVARRSDVRTSVGGQAAQEAASRQKVDRVRSAVGKGNICERECQEQCDSNSWSEESSVHLRLGSTLRSLLRVVITACSASCWPESSPYPSGRSFHGIPVLRI